MLCLNYFYLNIKLKKKYNLFNFWTIFSILIIIFYKYNLKLIIYRIITTNIK